MQWDLRLTPSPGKGRTSVLPLLLLLAAVFLVGCDRQPQLLQLPPDGVILAFGDSLTFGTGVTSEFSYPAVLANLSGRPVVRSGVPGEVSRAGLERLSNVLAEIKPNLVILCHGGKDILRRMNREATESNLRQMIQLVRASGAQVVLIAVPKLGLFPEAQPYYETIASELNVPVEFDILADLERDRAMKSDQIHFNRLGYQRMAEAVQALLIQAGAL